MNTNWHDYYRPEDDVEILNDVSASGVWVRGRVVATTYYGFRVFTVEDWFAAVASPGHIRHVDPILAAAREEAVS